MTYTLNRIYTASDGTIANYFRYVSLVDKANCISYKPKITRNVQERKRYYENNIITSRGVFRCFVMTSESK